MHLGNQILETPPSPISFFLIHTTVSARAQPQALAFAAAMYAGFAAHGLLLAPPQATPSKTAA